MKISSNNYILRPQQPHRIGHLSKPFNMQHIKNLPSTKEDVNVQNVIKDVINMNNNRNNNRNDVNNRNRNNNRHKNDINMRQNYNYNNYNNCNDETYSRRPHIIPFEGIYLNKIRTEFSTLFDTRQ